MRLAADHRRTHSNATGEFSDVLHETLGALRPGSDVLVVDDEEYIRYAVGRTLKRDGFCVRTASNGLQALDLMWEKVPALVVLDLKMPGMNGPEVLKEIRRNWGTFR